MILGHPLVLPDLGDSKNEEGPLFENGIPWRLPADADLMNSVTMLPRLSRPKDDQRAAAASVLAELATAFCALHEVAHVAAGHSLYQQQKFGDDSSGLVEFFAWRRKKHAAIELRRVWEFEADKIAAMLLVTWIRTDDAMRKDFGAALDIETSPEEITKIALFTVHILFRYMWQVRKQFRSADVHPDPLVRSLCVHGVMLALETSFWTRDIDATEQAFAHISDMADGAWLAIEAPIAESWTKSSSASLWPKVEQQLLQLEDAHARLRPQYQELGTLGEAFWRVARR